MISWSQQTLSYAIQGAWCAAAESTVVSVMWSRTKGALRVMRAVKVSLRSMSSVFDDVIIHLTAQVDAVPLSLAWSSTRIHNLISRQRRSKMVSSPVLPTLIKEVLQLPLTYVPSRRTSLTQEHSTSLVSDTIQDVARKKDGKLRGLESPHCLRLQAKILQR